MTDILETVSVDTVEAIARAPAWMLDVDGCLVRTIQAGGLGGGAMPGAPQFLQWLRDNGRRFLVCTNASQRPVGHYAAHLRQIGIDVADHELITAATAAAAHIGRTHRDVPTLAIGDRGLKEALHQHHVQLCEPESRSAGVVVVGAADTYATAELNAACLAVSDNDAALYVTADTSWFHGGMGRAISASTAIARAITSITGKRAQLCGKPSWPIAHCIRDCLQAEGSDLVVVGDSAFAEMTLARMMGAFGVLVLSGATKRADLAGLPPDQRPYLCADDVGELLGKLTAIVQGE